MPSELLAVLSSSTAVQEVAVGLRTGTASRHGRLVEGAANQQPAGQHATHLPPDPHLC